MAVAVLAASLFMPLQAASAEWSRLARVTRLSGGLLNPALVSAAGNEGFVAWSVPLNGVYRSHVVARGRISPPTRLKAGSVGDVVGNIATFGRRSAVSVGIDSFMRKPDGSVRASVAFGSVNGSFGPRTPVGPTGRRVQAVLVSTSPTGAAIVLTESVIAIGPVGVGRRIQYALHATIRPARGRFGAPVRLGVYDAGARFDAAITDRGEALVAWEAGETVRAARIDAAGSAGSPVQLGRGTVRPLRVATTPDGRATTVMWAGRQGVFVATSGPDESFAAPQMLADQAEASVSSACANSPHIGLQYSGDRPVAVWSARVGGRDVVRGGALTPGSPPSIQMLSRGEGNACLGRIAGNGTDVLAPVWIPPAFGPLTVARCTAERSMFGDAEPVSRVGPSDFPQAALLADGTGIMAWRTGKDVYLSFDRGS